MTGGIGRDGVLDAASLRRLLCHYAERPIDGLILGATTGEGLTLDDAELECLVTITAEELATIRHRVPLCLGLCGSHTAKLIKTLHATASWPIDCYLIACPYYTRPSQQGLRAHFTALADAASHPVLIYNIPYRTGVNLGNEAMLHLARHPNIVGLKDCCADPAQSFDLLRARPETFAILTGEDALFYTALTQGADGGILASAHIAPNGFAAVRAHLLEGRQRAALAAWQTLVELPRLLFAEPSPAPIKYWLWRAGLIDSPELRLPMSRITDALAARIDQEKARMKPLIPA